MGFIVEYGHDMVTKFENFISLNIPLTHPATEMHDTFFIKNPETCKDLNEEYVQRVKDVHEKGGYGSLGYRYDWSL